MILNIHQNKNEKIGQFASFHKIYKHNFMPIFTGHGKIDPAALSALEFQHSN